MVTVHAISRLGIETTGIEIVLDSCLISIAAAKQGGTAGEKEEVKVKVVHHKVPWLTEVSSSLVRRISASIGIDLSCLVNKSGEEELTPSEGSDAMKGLLDERVLRYIKEHGLYGYTSTPAPTPTMVTQGDSQSQPGACTAEVLSRAATQIEKEAPSGQATTVRAVAQVTQETQSQGLDTVFAEKQKRLEEDCAAGYAVTRGAVNVCAGVEVGGGVAKRARVSK
jgi:hypothetical protein